MGNRLDNLSPRHGKTRDLRREEEARKRYFTRAERRPKQRAILDAEGKFLGWEKVTWLNEDGN